MTSTLHPEPRLARIRRLLTTAAVTFAVLGPVLVLLGLFATKFGWVGWSLGLAPIRSVLGQQSIASFLAMLGAILGLIALGLALLVPPRRGYVAALVAIVLGGVTYGAFAHFWSRVRSHPPIHDVATDWKQPILFSPQLMAARGSDANPVETAPVVASDGPRGSGYLGRPVAEVNAMTCPGATPATLTLPPARAYVRAKAEVSREGLKIVTDNPAQGLLEATASDFWGLKDDLAVRITPAGAGSRVDFRAVSRHGANDLGRSCRLITRLRSAIGS